MSDDKSAAELFELLLRHFDLEELRTLCFQLGVDFDTVEGNGKSGKARELVLFMKRRDRLQELIDEIQLLRPNVQFTVPHDAAESGTSVARATPDTTADVSRTAEDVTGLLTSFLKSTAAGKAQDDQTELPEEIYAFILFFSQMEKNDYLLQTLRRFEEDPQKRQAVFQSTLLEALEESPLFLQALADLLKVQDGAGESRTVFKTDISGGTVGQVINVDKLEGGLNINQG